MITKYSLLSEVDVKSRYKRCRDAMAPMKLLLT